MPSATLRTFHRSRIYSTHPLHIWTSKFVSAIVANELCKTSEHKWFLCIILNVLFSTAKELYRDDKKCHNQEKKVFVAEFLNNRKKKTILESNLRIIGTTTK